MEKNICKVMQLVLLSTIKFKILNLKIVLIQFSQNINRVLLNVQKNQFSVSQFHFGLCSSKSLSYICHEYSGLC